MPKVNVEHAVKGSEAKVYAAVKEYLDGRDTLKKLGAKIVWKDKNHSGAIESDQFSGAIDVNETDGESLVSIVIDLPFLLSPFKGKVKEELTKHLQRLKV